MKRFLLLILLTVICQLSIINCQLIPLSAQESVTYQPVDSAYLAQLEQTMLRMEKEQQARKLIVDYEKKMLKRELSFNTTGALQLVTGLALTGLSNDYRRQAPRFTETSNDWRDYFVASIPGVATYAAKLCGVKSRSTTGRLFASTAMSLALSAGISSGLKGVISERRPDWSDDESMPSRHTALAFTAASILDREYGYISPWISVGGYAVASTTQFLRLKDNSHWLNDLYVGAAIGSVSANLGYFLTDRIFGEDGIAVKPRLTEADLRRTMKFEEGPASFCMVTGNEFGINDDWSCERTYFVGGELSYFFNEYMAAEGIVKMSSTKVNELQDNLLLYHTDAALKASYPIMPGLRVNARALAGGRFSEKIADIDDKSMELGCGVGLDFLNREKYAVGMAMDYYHVFSDIMKDRLAISATCRIIL